MTDPNDPITVSLNDIANMTTEEILEKVLLFKSYFSTACGPNCKCSMAKCNHFMGYMPDKLCEQDLDTMADLTVIPNFESVVSSLCPCQKSHFFKLKVEEGEVSFEATTEGEVMDKRRLRLPNF